jgi:hypothetical protein
LPGKFKIILKCIGLALFLDLSSINAQILQDTAAITLVKKDVYYIYNLQFSEARVLYSKIIRLYPEHPIVYLLSGILTYWENYPLLRTSPSRASFEEDMYKCIKVSETLKNPDHEAEFLLANLSARGMLMMFYDDNELSMDVIQLMANTYKLLKQAFGLAVNCPDLYYFTGTYNYYREAYPSLYPVYKPFLLFFPSGDMQLGIKELQNASFHSILISPESLSLLAVLYLKFENKYPESSNYWKILSAQYPDNLLYINNYIRNLLIGKNYKEAEKRMLASDGLKANTFFQAQRMILRGILQEKKYNDNRLAEKLYYAGITSMSSFGRYGDEFAAYAYFGLSRISEANGDLHNKKIYRKEALKRSDTDMVNFDN